ncbi:MAG: Gfo/Idh/MocA family oxidoreductase [Planctomycetaceae bacterium]|nr:Gfo/Idh/MocA family oxidoreductase [Planctomycetaceae bacterium]
MTVAKNTGLSRRAFGKGVLASAFAFQFVPSHVWGANERLTVAGIGVGGKGSGDIDQAGNYADVVAICDIDDERLKAKAKRFSSAKPFHDFRELLDTMGDKLDAVTVSTADHTHAAAAVAAMQLGKHVYCQKPLTHTVAEARLMRETARKYGVVTQMGNQGMALDGFRANVELVRSGALGNVREVHVWTNRPFRNWATGEMYWKQSPDLTARPKETPPVPDHVHWDLWLGPSPERPYHPIYHPRNWRGWWDFGTGALGDMACHTTAMPFLALELGLPTRVSAVSGEVNPETYPAWANITYEFPARGNTPPVKLVWYEGVRDGQRNIPDLPLPRGLTASESGSFLVGEKGRLYSPGDSGNTQELDIPGGFKVPEPIFHRWGDNNNDEMQKREWMTAIQGGARPLSNFDFASVLTETMLLGNVAVRLGKAIEYNGEHGRVTNVAEAVSLLSPPRRNGWGF